MPIFRSTPTAARKPAAPVSPIVGLSAGTVFTFSNSRKGNSGTCMRLKDSKAGKYRFVNLETGKVLKATGGEQIEIVPAGASLRVG